MILCLEPVRYELSKQIIGGQIHANQDIRLDLEGENLVFRNVAREKQDA